MCKRISRVKWFAVVYFTIVLVYWNGMDIRAEEAELDVSVFEYEENVDGTINIIDCDEQEETLVIPSEIDGKRVKAIKFNFGVHQPATVINAKHVIISNGITNIMRCSFRECKNLESISFPGTLRAIDESAFAYCNNLREINFSEGLVSIGEYAFESCNNLKNITLPNSLTSIGQGAFLQCRSLSKIIIPGNLKVIQRSTFFNCTNLQEVEIKEGVECIESAFIYCVKLQKVIIPKSVIKIGASAFWHPGIQDILPNVVIYADPNSYARIFAQENKIKFMCLNTHLWDHGRVTNQSIALTGNKKRYTCTYTCIACGKQKTGNATILKKGKKSVDSISKHVYKVTRTGFKNGTVEFVKTRDQNSLLLIPDKIKIDGISYKVTSVAKNALKNNKNVKKITIGKNVEEIKANAFWGCRNLRFITIQSKNLQRVGKGAFKGIQAKAKIKVPPNKLESYKRILSRKGQKSTVKIAK